MKVLFVCNQNKNRSRTAEQLFKSRFETKSAGLFNKNPVKASDLEWADLVIVMEDSQRSEISKRFPKQYMQKQILSLDIPDIYSYKQQKLVDVLNSKIDSLF
jgi:predicted protein tyrosine phosphatase